MDTLRKKQTKPFHIESSFSPAGDQPQAIEQLVSNYKDGAKRQTLLGVTGSGKTFTMAHVIKSLEVPTLILAPNKTLAAQLYAEFKELFPNNAVEYFVSYYDYYQPEAYIPSSDTYIEKDSAINEQIDRMRHSATRSLLERKDVIIVSSVSCIYGLGSPDSYEDMAIEISVNDNLVRDVFLRELIKIQYTRSDVDFHRGTFRVRGDLVEIHPSYEEDLVIRVEFFGDYIDAISWVDPILGEVIKKVESLPLYPASHYVTSQERVKSAITFIEDELRDRLNYYQKEMMPLEQERIEKRTMLDLEVLGEMGFCPGIENYSRHLTGRNPGEPPPTLIEFFGGDFLTILDESHVTVSQIGGMYRGDRARKINLVEHGFRLPSAMDNRPLNFDEFNGLMDKMLYVSATPQEYEKEQAQGMIIEQIIRPTGLLDPIIHVKPAKDQVEDIIKEIRIRVERKERVLVTTLTKRSAEELTDFLNQKGIKVKYLHSDIKTVERTDIIRDLRLGVFDVLIGINLLREGLDIPEVSLVAITDADKEGFLRSERSLIQTIGRAARNQNGEVILYGDRVTKSMKVAMEETQRRREIQIEYNKQHGITPQTVQKKVKMGLLEVFDQAGEYKKTDPGFLSLREKVEEYQKLPGGLAKKILKLKDKMRKAAQDLDFEKAAEIRDEVKRLQSMDLDLLETD